MAMAGRMRAVQLLALLLLAAGAQARLSSIDDAVHALPSLFSPAARPAGKTAAAQADRVGALPGLDSLDSDLWAGYVTVDADAGRALFYALVEASDTPAAEAPLVLWLNGGPGCSSLAGGFLSELGPYYPAAGGRGLQRNPTAWTRVANIIFLESPAFVGWSYSNTSSDAKVGDARTAADALRFLTGFFARFPEYERRPFWLAGESYGGHYVPNLALAIARHNRHAVDGERINLQGFLVGNAWTDPSIDNEGAVDFWYHHALISEQTKTAFKTACNFSTVGPLLAACSNNVDPQACRAVLAASALVDFKRINIYDVFEDVCLPGTQREALQLARAAPGHPAALGAHIAAAAAAAAQGEDGGSYDPCVDDEVQSYFNRRDVQTAMHANLTGELPGPWLGCSSVVQYSQKDLFTSMLPVYKELLKEDLQMLVYSGDVDGIVPVTGTRRWIRTLGLEIEKPWRLWHSPSGQVAGRVVEHDSRFTFATVRGAGHMVPYTQGERGFALFRAFIAGERLQ